MHGIPYLIPAIRFHLVVWQMEVEMLRSDLNKSIHKELHQHFCSVEIWGLDSISLHYSALYYITFHYTTGPTFVKIKEYYLLHSTANMKRSWKNSLHSSLVEKAICVSFESGNWILFVIILFTVVGRYLGHEIGKKICSYTVYDIPVVTQPISLTLTVSVLGSYKLIGQVDGKCDYQYGFKTVYAKITLILDHSNVSDDSSSIATHSFCIAVYR